MSITRQNPNTIFLGGNGTKVGDLAASAAISPGHLIDRFNNSGVIRLRKHATAGGACERLVATEQSMNNKQVTDAYAANDLVEAVALSTGATAWMHLASGQNIAAGDKLESAGDGTLRILASGVALFTALENKPTVTVDTMIRVEAL